MKTFRHILLLLQTALLFGLFTASCHDDLDTGLGSTPYEPTIGTGIVLKIPNLKAAATRAAATRADGFANTFGDEGTVNNGDIHLYIFPDDGDEKKTNYFHLGTPDFNQTYSKLPCLDTQGNPTYAGATLKDVDNQLFVEVPMYPGKYRLYILANLEDYAAYSTGQRITDFSSLNEDGITGMKLLFNGPVDPRKLPMICLPTDVDFTYTSDGSSTSGSVGSDGLFDILSKDVKSIQANLKFQVAKVRYTVLFDNEDSGFSFPQFKGTYSLSIDEAKVSNLATVTKVNGNAKADHACAATEHKFQFETGDNAANPTGHFKVKYPTQDGYTVDYPFSTSNTGSTSEERKKNLTKISSESGWGENSKQRAWQGIVYLPENLGKEENDTRTELILKGTVNGNGVTGGDNTYTIPLISGSHSTGGTTTTTNDAIVRGNFYDIRALAVGLHDTDITFSVEPWIPIQLFYELQGPVYLYVDKTNIAVKSGEATRFKYDSNVPVSFYSPEFDLGNGNKVEFYEIETEGDEIVVRINSRIPASDLTKLTDTQKKEYRNFHIVAGNINKKITVDPLDLTPFIEVNPDDITINVRSEVASGNYDGMIGDGAFEIVVKTNCGKYKVEATKWDELIASGENESDLIILCAADGTPVKFGEWRDCPSGQEILYLVYDKLNGGDKFWSDDPHTLGLTFSVDNTSYPVAKYPTAAPDNVPIYTKPGNDNFVIHMKPWSGWNDPHVYIYQCLEIPGWFSHLDYWYANRPVGYNHGGMVAALEYSFTGKISFLGWAKSENQALLTEIKKSDTVWNFVNDNYGVDGGFVKWQEFSLQNGDESKQKQHYNLDYDFFADYRASGKCKSCCTSGNSRTWPGIAMENEGNGWYKIVLSGAATPGKTLIMFANTHDGEGDKNRYPNDLEVGIPLFDYDTREGWIDMNKANKSFTSVDPNKPDPNLKPEPTSGKATFRIGWTLDKCNAIWIWPTGGSGTATAASGNNPNYYYEFEADVQTGFTMNWLYKEGADAEFSNRAKSTNFENKTKANFEWDGYQEKFIFKN